MPIIEASKARTKAEDTLLLRKEYEEEQKKRLAKEAEERAKRLADEQEALQAEENKRRTQKARVAKQRKLMVTKSIQAAAEGKFCIPIKGLEKDTELELTKMGLAIRTVQGDFKILKSGLYDHWGFAPASFSQDYSKVLDPLRRFLMISIIKAWRSRENDVEHIRRIATTILNEYYEDLKDKRISALKEKIQRLRDLDSDERHTEIQLSDFFTNRSSLLLAKKILDKEIFDIYIDVDNETEFFSVVESVYADLDLEDYLKRLVRDLRQQAESLTETLLSEFADMDRTSKLLSWWSAYFKPNVAPSSLAEELFWLASGHGQLFVSQLNERIEWAADEGEKTLKVTTIDGYGESFMAPILSKYLESMGYQVVLKTLEDKDIEITITW